MKVILQEDVEKLGHAGDLVNVAGGYARNYLIPRKLGLPATTKNLGILEHQKRSIEARMKKRQKEAQKLKEKLESLSCTVSKKVGEGEKLFGSVTSMDIEEALRAEELNIDRRQILLKEPIKSLGVYNVEVKLTKDVTATVKVWVVEK